MGKYNQQDVLWRLASIDGGATKYIPEFDQNDNYIIPIGECVFVQESATVDVEFENVNNYTTSDGICYRDGTNNTILANDYFLSNLDCYLSNSYAGQLGITENIIYTNILPRTKSDLQKDMGAIMINDENDDWTYYFDTYNCSSNVNISTLNFWSLSIEETCSLICGNNDNYFDSETMEELLDWGTFNHVWWTRTPYHQDTEVVYCVWDGDASQCDCVNGAYAIRPAFLFNL